MVVDEEVEDIPVVTDFNRTAEPTFAFKRKLFRASMALRKRIPDLPPLKDRHCGQNSSALYFGQHAQPFYVVGSKASIVG